jgi:hypothetical protein
VGEVESPFRGTSPPQYVQGRAGYSSRALALVKPGLLTDGWPSRPESHHPARPSGTDPRGPYPVSLRALAAFPEGRVRQDASNPRTVFPSRRDLGPAPFRIPPNLAAI